jgi:hypothetical protein
VPSRRVESSRPTGTLPCKRVELTKLLGGPRGLDPDAQRSLLGRLWQSLYPIGVTNRRIERAKLELFANSTSLWLQRVCEMR